MSLFSNPVDRSSASKQIIIQGTRSLILTDQDLSGITSCKYQIIIKKNSHLNFCIALMHTKSIDIQIEIDAQGNLSSFDIFFLYALSLDQNIKIITKQTHSGKNTKSRIFARGIVKDNAYLQHDGLILIMPDATRSDGVLNHTAIVLDNKAQVILIPSIEVLNYDVQCSHGAAVGQFDQQQLWYLKSRGCNDKEAYQMLVQSFFKELVDHFDQPEKLLESLCQKIISM